MLHFSQEDVDQILVEASLSPGCRNSTVAQRAVSKCPHTCKLHKLLPPNPTSQNFFDDR